MHVLLGVHVVVRAWGLTLCVHIMRVCMIRLCLKRPRVGSVWLWPCSPALFLLPRHMLCLSCLSLSSCSCSWKDTGLATTSHQNGSSAHWQPCVTKMTARCIGMLIGLCNVQVRRGGAKQGSSLSVPFCAPTRRLSQTCACPTRRLSQICACLTRGHALTFQVGHRLFRTGDCIWQSLALAPVALIRGACLCQWFLPMALAFNGKHH